ncbi:MAG TPA: cytochrome P450 [Planctomycetes bacterium]|nr:cytochrome P450 [Planctomycetota bacterium]
MTTALELPPLVPGHWLLGALPAFASDPLGLLAQGVATGEVARHQIVHRVLVQLNSPEGVGHVLQGNASNYVKSTTYRDLQVVLGEGLLTSEGAFWRRQRRIAQPSFKRNALGAFLPVFARTSADLVAEWRCRPAGQPLDVHAETTRLALRIAGLALFSADLQEEASSLGEAVSHALEFADQRTLSIVKPPLWFPWPGHGAFRRAKRTIDEALTGLIAERRAAGSEAQPRDLLSRLVFATDPETGESMSDQQLRDEVVTFFLAGHETTANALAWTLHLLAAEPELQARIAAEAEQAFGSRAPDQLEAEHVGQLELTRRAVEEGLRLYPPAWIIEREPLEDDEVGGYRVPKGAIVMLPTWVLHRREDLWPDPLRFDPDRFLPERRSERPRWAYFPFGGGQRQCIGAEFALLELQVILATLLRAFRLERAGEPPTPQASITLRPLGLELVAEAR